VVTSNLSVWDELRRFGVVLEVGSAQGYTENGTTRLQNSTRAQAVQPYGVVADSLDHLRQGVARGWVVAGDAERAALR
jgi:hypothetical protein